MAKHVEESGEEVLRRGSRPERIKPPKDPSPIPLGQWRQLLPEHEWQTWVYVLENLPRGRVNCRTRSGAELVCHQDHLGEPVKRTRKRQQPR